MDRRQRLKALGLDRVLILDRGNVELALPPGWTVERDPAGHLPSSVRTSPGRIRSAPIPRRKCRAVAGTVAMKGVG